MAYGFFNFASGVTMLASSVIAGAMWQAFGPAFTCYAGAAFAVLTLAGLIASRTRSAWT